MAFRRMIRCMSLSMYAQAIVAAYHDHRPVAAACDAGPVDYNEAYAVQRTIWQLLAGSTRPTAWKVAAAAPGETPIAAPILPQRLLESSTLKPATIPAHTLIRPGIEAEIAVRFGQDLPDRPAPYRQDEIRAAIAELCVAMEVVDTRLSDAHAAGANWRLADHLLNGALVIGTPIPDWQTLRFDALPVRVQACGQILTDQIGLQPLNDLFHCLPWLVNHAGGICAGDVVTTGAWTGMHPVGGLGPLPFSCDIEFSGLGSASVTFIQGSEADSLQDPRDAKTNPV